LCADGGAAAGQQILQADTVAEMSRDQLGGVPIRKLTTATPLAHDLEVLPGTPKGWGLSFLLILEQTPQGRPAGSLAWAGMVNSYYWIDPTKPHRRRVGHPVVPLPRPPSHRRSRSLRIRGLRHLRLTRSAMPSLDEVGGSTTFAASIVFDMAVSFVDIVLVAAGALCAFLLAW
jgi:hypothetical protein